MLCPHARLHVSRGTQVWDSLVPACCLLPPHAKQSSMPQQCSWVQLCGVVRCGASTIPYSTVIDTHHHDSVHICQAPLSLISPFLNHHHISCLHLQLSLSIPVTANSILSLSPPTTLSPNSITSAFTSLRPFHLHLSPVSPSSLLSSPIPPTSIPSPPTHCLHLHHLPCLLIMSCSECGMPWCNHFGPPPPRRRFEGYLPAAHGYLAAPGHRPGGRLAHINDSTGGWWPGPEQANKLLTCTHHHANALPACNRVGPGRHCSP